MTALIIQFGVTVRRLREARRWSQEHLAERAGLNRSYVGEVERAEVIASIVTLEKLANALDEPVTSLLQPVDAAAAARLQGARLIRQ